MTPITARVQLETGDTYCTYNTCLEDSPADKQWKPEKDPHGLLFRRAALPPPVHLLRILISLCGSRLCGVCGPRLRTDQVLGPATRSRSRPNTTGYCWSRMSPCGSWIQAEGHELTSISFCVWVKNAQESPPKKKELARWSACHSTNGPTASPPHNDVIMVV